MMTMKSMPDSSSGSAQTPASLEHRVLAPEAEAPAPHPTLVMLHGRGSDEEDLIGLAAAFDPSLMIVSARAPFPFPYGGGFTWYDANPIGTPDPEMFRRSCDLLSQFVDETMRAYPVDPARLYLLGFSMGTVMSYAIALTRPGLFRGVIANSGYVPEGTHLDLRWSEAHRTPFFIAHGTADPVLPLAMGRRAKKLFEDAHGTFEYREYPMAHEISQESLRDSAAFLDRLLKKQPAA